MATIEAVAAITREATASRRALSAIKCGLAPRAITASLSAQPQENLPSISASTSSVLRRPDDEVGAEDATHCGFHLVAGHRGDEAE